VRSTSLPGALAPGFFKPIQKENKKMEKKRFEIRIEEIHGIQAEIEDLVRKCGPAMTSSDGSKEDPSEPMAHQVRKLAGQLLAAMDKIINVGRDLNAITSCMLDVADSAQADNRDLGQVPHILAWAGWTCDLTSDILDAVDDLLRAGHDLIGSSHKVHNLKAQSASARGA